MKNPHAKRVRVAFRPATHPGRGQDWTGLTCCRLRAYCRLKQERQNRRQVLRQPQAHLPREPRLQVRPREPLQVRQQGLLRVR